MPSSSWNLTIRKFQAQRSPGQTVDAQQQLGAAPQQPQAQRSPCQTADARQQLTSTPHRELETHGAAHGGSPWSLWLM